ncbi:AAA family ATPase [Sphingomonas turrisvirgatae]|uniref:General secretion pathway protein GspA n=1 Tax=Sphingomonas turrisvirgatae TaxID=1888892 RepID=A0A1E3LVK0_9SPHN|nr:AAA family ATPase [Sphingomonas turrisvirgatae]ODP36840.1 general secretion pathway protein GspA [Sphingomonas turrisvirgatae]
MYHDHYGLSARPFQLTPDPAFWFDTATHRKAMAYLGYGLSQAEGFVVITGDPGAGKTTLVGHLMDTIDRERLHVVQIVTTQIDAHDLLHLVAKGLGVNTAGMAKAQVLGAVEKGLHAVARGGKRTLLVVDEAQALPTQSVEELRMLSNFQAGGHALLQIFLLGQPEFRERMADASLEQLRQRVIAMHHLDPMGAEELGPYLAHRLSIVGWNGRPNFTDDAVAAMHRATGGSPRKINQLAGRVLLFGAIELIDTFDAADVEAVVADMTGDMLMRETAEPAPAASSHVSEATVEAEANVEADVDPVPEPQVETTVEASGEAAPAPAPSMTAPADDMLLARISRLEARLEEQDAALRRVLTLMVDFIENDGGEPVARGAAA